MTRGLGPVLPGRGGFGPVSPGRGGFGSIEECAGMTCSLSATPEIVLDLGSWGKTSWNIWHSRERLYEKHPELAILGSWDTYALWALHGRP